jgi:UMF1 family MFS transporter
MGFEEGAEITLFVVLTVPAIVGSALAGILADRIGPRRTLLGVLWVWVGLMILVVAARSQAQFWGVGALIGLVFGGVWASERPLLLTLVPGAESGRFFGLLVLSARVAAIFGPLLWALIVDHLFAPFGPAVAYRAAVGSLVLLMLLAIAILRGVPDRRPIGGGGEPR